MIIVNGSLFLFGGWDRNGYRSDLHSIHFDDVKLDMGSLLENSSLNEIEFLVDDQKFPGHLAIFSVRCPLLIDYIKSQVTPDLLPFISGDAIIKDHLRPIQIKISGIQHEVFRCMMEYIYTDYLSYDHNYIVDLRLVAERFGLHRMRKLCARYIQQYISPLTAISILQSSDKNGVKSVKSYCLKYIAQHYDQIVFQDEIKGLGADLIVEVMRAKVTNAIEIPSSSSPSSSSSHAFSSGILSSPPSSQTTSGSAVPFSSSSLVSSLALASYSSSSGSTAAVPSFSSSSSFSISSSSPSLASSSASMPPGSDKSRAKRPEEHFDDDFSASTSIGGSLKADLEGLVGMQKYSDFSFKIQDSVIPAHNCILAARLPTFSRSWFSSGMREAQTRIVEIENVKKETFMMMLLYIYSGDTTISLVSEGLDLLLIADRYLIDSLKSRCENFLYESVDHNNVLHILQVSDSCRLSKLRERCLEYIVKNSQIISTIDDGRRSLLTLSKDILVDIIHALATTHSFVEK